jgi:hypothetical protein
MTLFARLLSTHSFFQQEVKTAWEKMRQRDLEKEERTKYDHIASQTCIRNLGHESQHLFLFLCSGPVGPLESLHNRIFSPFMGNGDDAGIKTSLAAG